MPDEGPVTSARSASSSWLSPSFLQRVWTLSAKIRRRLEGGATATLAIVQRRRLYIYSMYIASCWDDASSGSAHAFCPTYEVRGNCLGHHGSWRPSLQQRSAVGPLLPRAQNGRLDDPCSRRPARRGVPTKQGQVLRLQGPVPRIR